MYNLCLFPIGSFLIFFVTGCVSYQTKPLVPIAIFSDVDYTRQKKSSFEAQALTFSKAALLMNKNNPELDEVRANYETFQSIANIKTPWPNPSLDLGPDLGSKLGPGAVDKTQPFIGLGFTIPLGGKMMRNDDLNIAQAMRSFVEVQAKHRELYLELRGAYTRFYLAFRKQEIQDDLVSSSKAILKLTKSLMKAGASTALDLGMIELDTQKVELEALDLNNEREEILSMLSILLGLDASRFKQMRPSSIPDLNQPLPGHKNLKTILIKNHLELARLRYDYEVAEKNLRLQISKQYPDIQFGADREREVGEKTVIMGLRLGIKIPVFDRNRQGIAQATKEREHIRKQYVTIAHEALSHLKKSYESIKLHQKKYYLLNKDIQKRAKMNLKIAKQSLESGGIDTLKYLDVLRTYQQTMKDIALVESDVRLAWLDLEKVLGYPLIKYPGESKFNITLDPQAKSVLKENSNEK